MMRNSDSPAADAVAPTRAFLRPRCPAAGARISVRDSRHSISRCCACAEARSASAMRRPSRAAERRPSAARATDTRCSSDASVVLPLAHQGAGALERLTAPRPARPRPGRWCCAPARSPASARARVAAFWASCVSRTSRDSRASTCPCFTTVAFLDQHLGDAVALDLGRDQDLLARNERAGDDRALDEIALGGADDRDGWCGRGVRLRRLRERGGSRNKAKGSAERQADERLSWSDSSVSAGAAGGLRQVDAAGEGRLDDGHHGCDLASRARSSAGSRGARKARRRASR